MIYTGVLFLRFGFKFLKIILYEVGIMNDIKPECYINDSYNGQLILYRNFFGQ